MQTVILYAATAVLVVISLIKNKQKTKKAMIKAWKAFENILPQLLGVVIVVGIALALLDTETISAVIGSASGWYGVAIASVIGAVTLIPGFIAFPTAALLLVGGAGYMQIAAFVSSLMMVGVVTLPVEIRYLGKRSALIRNAMAFVFSFAVALVIGKVMGEI
ncbi:MAG: permease [Eubacteriales bacterium]|nr:permease [Eubacteriales bacterium]